MRLTLLLLTIAVIQLSTAQDNHDSFPSGRVVMTDGRAVDIRDLLSSIKDQIKDVIRDLISQATTYLTQSLNNFRVKFLRKVGSVSLSSALHWVFDGIPGFIEPESADTWSYREPGNAQQYWTPTTTEKHGESADLFSFLSHNEPGNSVKDEDYSEEIEEDREPNDVRGDYTFMDVLSRRSS